MTDIITMLNNARREHRALQSTWNLHFCHVEGNELLAYIKMTDDLRSIILVIVNLDAHNTHSGYVQLPKHLLKIGDHVNVKLQDIATGENYTWTQEWNYVELNPDKMPFHLFHLEVHESFM
jgi:starch synthase (maltosyl-transferring)